MGLPRKDSYDWRMEGLAEMSASMSGEYVSDLDIENLPDMTVGNHAEDERNVAGKDLKDASCEWWLYKV